MNSIIQEKKKGEQGLLWFGSGFLFAILWSSASTATKIGLQSAQPFVISIVRFFVAGGIMLFISHGLRKKRMPQKKEWKQLAIYGLLNISIYLGMFVVAMQEVSPGLGSLAIATNPVFISIISSIFFSKPVSRTALTSLAICASGVFLAAYPLIHTSYASPKGLLILFTSMLAYSAGALYFSTKKWNDLDILTINGWQTLLGGIFLLPVALLTYKHSANVFDTRFITCILWLAVPVSIIAVQLWLFLLKKNVVTASFWLFLCPLSGYIIANIFVKEPIGIYTIAGMAMVITGLYLVQVKKRKAT